MPGGEVCKGCNEIRNNLDMRQVLTASDFSGTWYCLDCAMHRVRRLNNG